MGPSLFNEFEIGRHGGEGRMFVVFGRAGLGSCLGEKIDLVFDLTCPVDASLQVAELNLSKIQTFLESSLKGCLVKTPALDQVLETGVMLKSLERFAEVSVHLGELAPFLDFYNVVVVNIPLEHMFVCVYATRFGGSGNLFPQILLEPFRQWLKEVVP